MSTHRFYRQVLSIRQKM